MQMYLAPEDCIRWDATGAHPCLVIEDVPLCEHTTVLQSIMTSVAWGIFALNVISEEGGDEAKEAKASADTLRSLLSIAMQSEAIKEAVEEEFRVIVKGTE